jgi:tetratricopeptide (TPR) repeat protein
MRRETNRYGRSLARYLLVVGATILILLLVSSASLPSSTSVHRVSPMSLAMQHEGARLLAIGELDSAVGFYETALVADPRNVDALIGLGDIARDQHLPGKAIGHYRAALALRPTDRLALAGQGEAYIARGAMAQARRNLATLETLCRDDGCAQVAQLSIAINRGDISSSTRTALRTEQLMPQPVIEAAPLSN